MAPIAARFTQGWILNKGAGDKKQIPANGDARALEAGQVELLYAQCPSGLFATLIVGILLVIGLWTSSLSKAAIGLWLGAIVALCAARYWLLWRYRLSGSQATDPSPWKRLFLVGVALNGLLWGAAGFCFFIPESYIHRSL